MSRWKALPGELDPPVRQLVVQLRRLKDHSGLSLRRLAARTDYSATSWERYLGGRALPPAGAVEALARIGGENPVRLLALHEVATDSWTGSRTSRPGPGPQLPPGTTESPTPTPGSTPGPTGRAEEGDRPGAAQGSRVTEPGGAADPAGASDVPEAADPPGASDLPEAGGSPGPVGAVVTTVAHPASPAALTGPVSPPPSVSSRFPRAVLVAGSVALVLAVSSATLLVIRLADPGHGAGTAPPPHTVGVSAPASASASARPAYTCRLSHTGGHWYAGLSRETDAEVGYGDTGPEVAEAQCLLRRAGISPGGIDGIFGPLTRRAVEAMQKRSHLVVDGIVGPHTWKALRG